MANPFTVLRRYIAGGDRTTASPDTQQTPQRPKAAKPRLQQPIFGMLTNRSRVRPQDGAEQGAANRAPRNRSPLALKTQPQGSAEAEVRASLVSDAVQYMKASAALGAGTSGSAGASTSGTAKADTSSTAKPSTSATPTADKERPLPTGDGWGMKFLQQAERGQALRDMAWDTDFAPEELHELLSHHPDLEATDAGGDTPLVSAALCGNVAFMKVLIEHGADVNARDTHGNTALHELARGDAEAVRYLLDAGADPHALNRLGATALFGARSVAVVKLLLDAGTPVNQRDAEGNTALMRLVDSLKSGADATFDPRQRDGNNVVQRFADLKQMLDAVPLILGHGADLSMRNNKGRSFQDLMAKFYGISPSVIPGNARQAKDFIELLNRESAPMFSLRDRKTARPAAAQRAANTRAAERVAAPPAQPVQDTAASGRKPINKLPSGHKIDLVHRPHTRFEQIAERDANAVSQALGFGELAGHAEQRSQQLTAVRNSFAQFAGELDGWLENYDNSVLARPELRELLSPDQRMACAKAMEIAHMRVAAVKDGKGRVVTPIRLRVFFEGTQNLRDAGQDARSAFGLIGPVDRAARSAGEFFAKILSQPDKVQLEFVSGQSMGGAMAQTFLATVQSRTKLPKQPSMILLDPQLLNNGQARRATQGGDLHVDYSRPRGVAITLDYAKAPHRGLMGIMKGAGGYRYPGLVQIKLGLTDTDGPNETPPETSGPPGLGYHIDPAQFSRALARFTEDHMSTILQDPAMLDARPLRWKKPSNPHRSAYTLPAFAERRRFPMETISETEGAESRGQADSGEHEIHEAG